MLPYFIPISFAQILDTRRFSVPPFTIKSGTVSPSKILVSAGENLPVPIKDTVAFKGWNTLRDTNKAISCEAPYTVKITRRNGSIYYKINSDEERQLISTPSDAFKYNCTFFQTY